MLDHEHRNAFALDASNEVDADLEFGGIEAGQPFVEQQELRPGGEGPGQLDALLVNIGELGAELIGPNGSGKTTVLNLITGELTPDAGSILLDGKEIIGAQAFQVNRARIARTFQLVRILPGMTTRENVSLPNILPSDTFSRVVMPGRIRTSWNVRAMRARFTWNA